MEKRWGGDSRAAADKSAGARSQVFIVHTPAD